VKKLLFLLLFLPSCEKEYCWDCTLNTWKPDPASPSGTYVKTQQAYCNKTEKEIEEMIYSYGKANYKNNMTCEKQ
jgi:hypothetical protein